MKNKRIRSVYTNMKTRCYNPNSNRYYCYGGRGIKVCEDWKNNFANFKEWALNNGYAENLTLDRINNNGDYEPNNCRWVTYKQQRLNSTTNRIVEFYGNKKTITEWCEYFNIPYYVINNRVNKYGWDMYKALTTPIMKKTLYDCYGEFLTVPQIHFKYGIPKYAIYRKFKKVATN